MEQALRPLFVSVTWGAGGSTATKSLELAEICQRQLGLTTCLHLTCTNMSRGLVDEALEEAKALGIRNILALRGDPPRPEEYHVDGEEDSNKDFSYAVDLVKYIRQKHGDYFCVAVAGYPEGASDESHPEHQSVEHDLPFLVEKVAAGADFIMTQLTYDLNAYAKYEATLRSHPSGLFKTIPIIPGLMPIQSYQIVKRITNLAHAKIPPEMMSRIEAVKSDDEAVKRVGVDILSEIVEGIKALPRPPNLPRGLHFYTLNLEKSVAFILERCNLIATTNDPSPSDSSDSDIAVTLSDTVSSIKLANGGSHDMPHPSHRRKSSIINAQPHNRVILQNPSQTSSHSRHGERGTSSNSSAAHEAPERGVGIPASNPTRSSNLLISEGQGALGREATWDDFPNGRWGPSNSPAFGEIDGYGPSLKLGPVAARRLWGFPKKKEDITNIFKRHVLEEIPCVPWSDETDISENAPGALREETRTIRKELLTLIEGRGYWTLASQPAVNGVRSDHKVYGWGPPGEGFVFQKAFVEFFVSRSSWEEDLKPMLQQYPEEEISWLKTDANGNFESSTSSVSNADKMSSKPTPGATGVLPVTWGVFRGKEIVTPTIIEEQSFRAWGEEAYGIWSEWRRVFPRGSEEEQFLEKCRAEMCLVNCVGQHFQGKDGGRLWEILTGKESIDRNE
jgi:methylenetetrahydrofolate reductase (NADPH)